MSVPPPAPASGPSPHVAEGFAWWAPFVAFLIAFGAGGVAFAIVAAALGGDTDAPAVSLVATLIQDAALLGAMLLLARASGVRITPAAFGLRRVRFRQVITITLLAFIGFWLFFQVWAQLDPGAEDDLATDLGADQSAVALVAVAILTTLIAPMVEELFFRGFLFGALRRVARWWWAAALAGVLFAGVHLGTPAIFLVPLAVLGFLLCMLYQRTGSLIPGMGVHAFNNALALGISLEWSALAVVVTLIAAPTIVVLIASEVAKR